MPRLCLIVVIEQIFIEFLSERRSRTYSTSRYIKASKIVRSIHRIRLHPIPIATFTISKVFCWIFTLNMYQPGLVIGVFVSCLLRIDTTMAQLEMQYPPPSQTISPSDLPHSSVDIPRVDGAGCMDPISQPQYTVSLPIYRSKVQVKSNDEHFVM